MLHDLPDFLYGDGETPLWERIYRWLFNLKDVE